MFCHNEINQKTKHKETIDAIRTTGNHTWKINALEIHAK